MSPDSTIALAKQVVGKTHAGPIHSSVAGRTDHLPMSVEAGAYVIPADIISAMGEGNTMAGFKIAEEMFGEPGKKAFAAGGSVPIVAAGGEYVISPDAVTRLGDGDMDRGHKALDHFVRTFRQKTIKTLRGLAPPKRD